RARTTCSAPQRAAQGPVQAMKTLASCRAHAKTGQHTSTVASRAQVRRSPRQWLYFDRRFNEMVYQMPRIFPDASAENVAICALGAGSKKGFSALITDTLPNYDNLEKGQCFPLYLYDTAGEDEAEDAPEMPKQDLLFASENKPTSSQRTRRDAITDAGLAHFCAAYPNEAITKEDLFYYVYGLLHSPGYRERYADNLAKELPRIPRVKTPADFWAFSQAGRDLAALHLNYETVEPYPLRIESGGQPLTDADYRVEKMRYGKADKDKDLTTLHYNDKITLTGIPLEAYAYVVNGKPALDWVVERQGVKTDKASGIVNDANAWAIETMHNPRYPLELFMRVVTVSLETMKIVRGLPGLDVITSN
ncbi:MAG: damage-inducible protein, partial [Betaproteobacteria bacterium]|nr:damage-inducible protein [Betaproteobacteria bacterium]